MASNSQQSAQESMLRTQQLQSLRFKRAGTQMKQGRLERAELDQTTDGKHTFSLSKPSGQSSGYAALRSSRARLGEPGDMNADLDLEAPGVDREEPQTQYTSVPKPISQRPPAPSEPPVQPMLITLGQPTDAGGEQATDVQSLVNIVQEPSLYSKHSESQRSSKKKLERKPSLNSQKSKKEPTSQRALPGRLQFKRNFSSSNLKASERKSTQRQGSSSKAQAASGETLDPLDNRRLLTDRHGGLMRHGQAQQAASAHCLNLETLQKDLSELDQ